jgi:hypothetical protein
MGMVKDLHQRPAHCVYLKLTKKNDPFASSLKKTSPTAADRKGWTTGRN